MLLVLVHGAAGRVGVVGVDVGLRVEAGFERRVWHDFNRVVRAMLLLGM